ncbi:fused MFS/spermidine synthase [Bauldia sp.]|uniref:fused MFS/spermidine synthase n=1 Tax=Bauldia sp. TaxID=2575872 RepID=UPI003BA8C57C
MTTAEARRPPLYHRLAVSPGAALLVLIDVFTLGFVTLGFEMVASRILTPLFGSGIYTWATIISIVVGGLMAGYFLGGIIADRFPGFGLAAVIKFLACGYLFFVYAMAQGGLERSIVGIDSEFSALFVSGFVVCFPPLVVLGMYSPLSVRLLLREPRDAGKISGGLFALSSFGNILGIIVTTFVFIPTMGTRDITYYFATFLLASGFVSLSTRAMMLARRSIA